MSKSFCDFKRFIEEDFSFIDLLLKIVLTNSLSVVVSILPVCSPCNPEATSD